MILALILSFLLLTNDQVKEENVVQANFYLESYETSTEKDIYLWAFNELYFSNCSTDSNIDQILQSYQLNFLYSFYISFDCSSDLKQDHQKLKLQALGEFSLTNGYLNHAISYLVGQPEMDLRAGFFEEFISRWGYAFSTEELDILKLLSERASLSGYEWYFEREVFPLFLSLTNEDYIPF